MKEDNTHPQLQKERYEELDIARGICVLIMVVNHVNLNFASEKLLENPLFHITQEGIGGVAVLFMFLMGMNIVFSKKNRPVDIFIRGIKLLSFGYLFNFFRDCVPSYVGSLTGAISLPELGYQNSLEIILENDIFQFVGLAFMFVGALRLMKISTKMEFALAFAVSLLTIVIGPVSTKEHFSNWLTELIIGGWRDTYFPFISWILLPVTGAFFARHIKSSPDRRGIYQNIVKWSFITYTAFWSFLLYYYPDIDFFGWKDQFNYYRQNTFGNIFFISQVLFVIGICYFALINDLIPERIRNFLAFWSKNITTLYVVSWLFIRWPAWMLVGFNTVENPIVPIIASIVCVVITHLTVKHLTWISRSMRALL